MSDCLSYNSDFAYQSSVMLSKTLDPYVLRTSHLKNEGKDIYFLELLGFCKR